MPDDDTERLAPVPPPIPSPVPVRPRRAAATLARRRQCQALGAAGALILASLVGLLWLGEGRTDGHATGSAQATASTEPAACAEARSLARQLAHHAGPLAQAALRHKSLMERLDLFLEGKPGGLSGQQVYELGEEQMAVFEKEGPATQKLAHQVQEVAAQCQRK